MNPVFKNVLAAIAGYAAMVAIVFITFSILWMLLSPAGSFEPGTWDISAAWAVASLVLGLLAAIAGGLVCAKLGSGHQATLILIGIVVVLGVLAALPEASAVVGPRPDDVSMFDAMTSAQQPRWVTWLNPLIGAVGVVIGGRLGTKDAGAGGSPAL